MRMTSAFALRRAFAAPRPPKPPPTITTRGVFDFRSSAPLRELRLASFIHPFLKLLNPEISEIFAPTTDCVGETSGPEDGDQPCCSIASFINRLPVSRSGPIPLPGKTTDRCLRPGNNFLGSGPLG